MFGRARRLTPLLVWLGLCGVLGGIALVETSLHGRWQRLQAARSTYLLAIAQTQLNLSQILARVGNDGALAQNLKWKLSHSVKATLEGMVDKGQLDLVALYGPGCSDMGRAGSSSISAPCPSAEMLRAKTDSFQWLNGPDSSALVMVRPLEGNDVNLIAATGAVSLDEQWLSLQPELKAALSTLGLHLSQRGAVALVEPPQTTQGPAATLRSDNLIDRIIYATPVQRWFFSTSLIWPCLLLTLGWGSFLLWRENASFMLTQIQIASFVDWCRSLASSSAAIVPDAAKKPDHLREIAQGLPQARHLVSHALQVKTEAMQGLRQKRQLLETQLKEREEELQKLSARLAELAELDSLAVQLKRTTAIFLKRMDLFHSDVDDLNHLTTQAIVREGEGLQRLAQQWKQGTTERGSRKFIRSLAETPAAGGSTQDPANEPTATELDRQLDEYHQHSMQLSDLAMHAGRITAQLVKTSGFATRLAALWHGLALKSHDIEPCEELLAPIEEAQALIQLEPNLAGVAFANPLGEELDLDLPAIPKAIWVSSLYHGYLALAELGKGESLQVATRIRDGGHKILLVMQVVTSSGKALPQRSERQAYHLEIARSMLAPFQVSLSVLPALDGPYPIVLSWIPKRGTLTPRAAEATAHDQPRSMT